ncbi:MAG: CHASE3 domain-containing protein, partial [Burkholderiaceae bacterium]
MVLNEFTYQHSWNRLTSSITLTDARVRASQTLQLVSDAETGVRSYMMTARPSYLELYRKAMSKMETVQEDGFRLIEQADAANTIRTTEIRRLLATKLAELRTVIDFNETGRKEDALTLILS